MTENRTLMVVRASFVPYPLCCDKRIINLHNNSPKLVDLVFKQELGSVPKRQRKSSVTAKKLNEIMALVEIGYCVDKTSYWTYNQAKLD